MNLSIFSLKSVLPYRARQRSFAVSAAAQLARRLSPGRAQTCSLSEPFHVRIPLTAQAALAKTSIRSKIRQIHLDKFLRVAWLDLSSI